MAKRQVVLRRILEKNQLNAYGRNYCQLCNKTVHPSSATQKPTDHDTLTADHIVPKAKGGLDTITNIQIACYECNQTKRDSYDPTDLTIKNIIHKLIKLENRV